MVPGPCRISQEYAPLAFKMNIFFELLTNNTKETPYPQANLDNLWSEIFAKPVA